MLKPAIADHQTQLRGAAILLIYLLSYIHKYFSKTLRLGESVLYFMSSRKEALTGKFLGTKCHYAQTLKNGQYLLLTDSILLEDHHRVRIAGVIKLNRCYHQSRY